jgi:cytochrome c-type biogenesis protein
MQLTPASLLFGLVAGVLSTASPCVLPLLPMVLGPAIGAHRLGLAALTAGLATSFVAVGLFVATIGFSIGLDGDVFRMLSAVILGPVGVVLLSSALQDRFALATGGISTLGNRLIDRIAPSSLGGWFLMGALLGAVWTPCAGPTLGAASLLAAQGKSLPEVAAVMLTFGVGASVPLLVVGAVSGEALRRWRGRMLSAGRSGKWLLGASALMVSLLILTGADHVLETVAVAHSPDWLIRATAAF